MHAVLHGTNKSDLIMADLPNSNTRPKVITTFSPPYREDCNRQKERQCQDGSCIPRIELCPEEQLINQNTILIMIVVGIAVVVFVVILYCLQQRRRYRDSSRHQGDEAGSGGDDCDNVSLYQPPPSYDEVISSNLYPPTPNMRLRLDNMGQLPEDDPITPPPNYDTALYILSRSQELSSTKPFPPNRLVRRSVSQGHVSREGSQSPPQTPMDNEVFFNNNNNNSNGIPPPPSPREK